MQFESWRQTAVALAFLLAVVVSNTSAASPQSDTIPPAAAAASAATPTASPPPENQSGFPRLQDLNSSVLPATYDSPVGWKFSHWQFAMAKLCVIVAAILLWLKGLQLCVSADDEDDFQAAATTRTLFRMGFAGIIIALILPAYVPAACILLATSIAPYFRYMRLRKHVGSPGAVPAHGEQPVFEAVDRKQAARTTEVQLLDGKVIGSSNATIKLIGKSPLAQQTNLGISAGSHNAPAFQYALALIDDAIRSRATDLHINTKLNHIEIRHRIDGSLYSLGELPLDVGLAVINVFKVMCDLNIADRRRSQDGSFLADVNGRRLSFRVSSQGTQTGEILSIRVLDPRKIFSDFGALGMSPPIQEHFARQLQESHGLILIVGAAGAGKSTTACAALQTISSSSRNIVSIEDPIEYQIPSVDQIEVNYRASQTFASALRSVLRLDADVIFIGEIRDEETARIACEAAQTGQLVLATMHASDAISGALRLARLGADPQGVASSLRAVLSQTLVRKLCTDCRTPATLDAATRERLGITDDFEGQVYTSPDPAAVECHACDGHGFFRRTGVYELLEMTPDIRDLIGRQATTSAVAVVARKNEMTTLREGALQLVREGIISLDELNQAIGTS
jgi:general secretion pathway protein E